MPYPNKNEARSQTLEEILRDLKNAVEVLKPGEEVSIRVKKPAESQNHEIYDISGESTSTNRFRLG